MSVVIGIRCSNGIVLGSDSAASLMSQGTVTAQQRSMKKVAASGLVLSGIAGHTGLGQRIRAELEGQLNAGKWTGDRQSVMSQMRRYLWHGLVELEMRAAEATFKTIGHPSCTDSARVETLVATVIENRPELIHLSEAGAPTLIEDGVPFCSIGVGQQTADPFLAFARRILWPAGLPTLATGLFTVAWTVTHVVQANPNGIGEPVQLGILERDGENWIARELPAFEIKEHCNNVAAAEEGLRDWFSSKDAMAAPTKPPR